MRTKDRVEQLKEWEDTAEKQEFVYPMWFKSKTTGDIVEFMSLTKGKVVFKNPNHRRVFDIKVGDISYGWIEHTRQDNWKQVENPETVVDEAIKEVIEEDYKNSHYKTQKIDTVARCKANMTLEQQKAICIFSIDKYSHREKGQNLSDIQKVRYYLDWLEDIEIKLSCK